MKKAIIYGIGNNCNIFMKYACNKDFEIVAYADSGKAGLEYCGKMIIKPEDICFIDYDAVFLMISNNRQKIKKMMVEEYHIAKECIYDVDDLNELYMLSEIEKYKYVFFASHDDSINLPYSDVAKREDVTVRSVLWCGGTWRLSEVQSEKLYFIFFAVSHHKPKVEGFYEYLRKRFPNGKQISIVSDLFAGYDYTKEQAKEFPCELKEWFDLVVTYHSEDAKEQGIVYYEFPYSILDISGAEEEADLFFVGQAKNRLAKIHDIYKAAKSAGVSCRFWINNVKEEDMLEGAEGITYNEKISYLQYLKEMMKCRCILELCQINDKTTIRFSEAVVYNKKLLVDDMTCNEKSCYNPKYMQRFSCIEEVDYEWIKKREKVDYHYNGEFSPIRFLQFIDNYFSKI